MFVDDLYHWRIWRLFANDRQETVDLGQQAPEVASALILAWKSGGDSPPAGPMAAANWLLPNVPGLAAGAYLLSRWITYRAFLWLKA